MSQKHYVTARFKDRSDHDMVLAAAFEAAVAHLTRREIQSYRQLPQLLYHIQDKFRDDSRPRAGLIRAREFTTLDSYSLDRDREGLDRQYQAHYEAYFRIFNRCGLPVRAVGADAGRMGGLEAHEYIYLTPGGEETLLFCTQCDYAANRQVAVFRKPDPEVEELQPLEKVATPGASTIAELAAYLGISPAKTAKAIFLMAEVAEDPSPRMVFAVLRGDMTLNETKLSNALSAAGKGNVINLVPATDVEIAAIGASPGYGSPVGIEREKVWVVADDLLLRAPNLVAGANEPGYHLCNTNLGRDYQADIVADIVMAEDGAHCPHCGGRLKAQCGVTVGNIFKLGSCYTDAVGASYLDEAAQPHSILMGSYGVDAGRLMACVAEEHHDLQGLIWPDSITPYPVHLVVLGSKDGSVEKEAETFYQALIKSGLEPLYDDRNERAGVKFNDADLIGIPLRVTISDRSLTGGGFEFKRRTQDERWVMSVDEAIETIKQNIYCGS